MLSADEICPTFVSSKVFLFFYSQKYYINYHNKEYISNRSCIIGDENIFADGLQFVTFLFDLEKGQVFQQFKVKH